MGTIKGSNFTPIVKAVCVSKEKGTKKKAVKTVFLRKDHGLVDDAHAGSPRQVSLLAEESIDKMRAKGLVAGFGDFGENIITEGIDLRSLPLGAKIKIDPGAVLEITQIGKVCLSRCAIYERIGDCIMPRDGVFAKVLKGGVIGPGAKIEVIRKQDK